MSNHPSVENLIFSQFGHDPTDGQREACSRLVDFLFEPDSRVAFILRGYAGTGKTSLVSALIRTAPRLRVSTRLLAPTGRAAKVLASYSGRPAYTIHKSIYITGTDATGRLHTVRAPNKYRYTLFIVDEASMIGLDPVDGQAPSRSLLEDLIDYVADGDHCRLLLMGDTAQLPPVGSPESPALDASYLGALSGFGIMGYELCEVVRQRDESGILLNATMLRERIAEAESGMQVSLPLLRAESSMPDVIRLAGADLEETLQREYSEVGVESVVMITRSNKRANLYNQAIRNRVLFREEEINAGDYLMVVRNNYHWTGPDSEMGFLANGDIAEVMSARNFRELYGFHFADATLRFVDYGDDVTCDCKVLLETLHCDAASLPGDDVRRLFDAVEEDYRHLAHRADRMKAVKADPYYNALQVKFAYSLTCHKTQGGQWPVVFLDLGYLTDEMMDREFLRWLYTAFTRATQRIYLINFEDRFFF